MDKKNLRGAVLAFHLINKKPVEIAKMLNVQPKTVYRIIQRYQETGTTDDRPKSGRPATVNTPKLRARIKQLIKRNNQRSMRRIAKDVGVGKDTIRNMIKKNFGLYPYKLLQAQLLTERHKLGRLQKCRAMLSRFRNKGHRRVLFTDEKVFSIEQYHNRQNDRQLLPKNSHKNPDRTRISRSQGPASVMVWAGICASGKTHLIFIEKGVKINSEVYQSMLINEFLPWAENHFGNQHWILQQDGATSHTSNSTQTLCYQTCNDFIAKKDWPANSPDLNPMDYSVWGILEQKLAGKRYTSVQKLKQALQKAWGQFTQEELLKIVDNFPKRLTACIQAQGGHFEC